METHAAFPEKVNFSIVNHLNRTQLRSRVWERGAGMTMACGTGACAQTVAAHIKGLIDDDIQVALPGGNLKIAWDGHSSIFMEGPATEVFQGEWPEQTK
jgi:diaminopimelate epimerase